MSGTLSNFVSQVGAPNMPFSDNSKVQIGAKIQNILHHCSIKDQQCEPHHHQSCVEGRVQEVVHLTNAIMDCAGTPAQH
jgi:hypothetical protein